MTVWLGEAEWAGLDATAAAADVETGALAKEALLRGYAAVGRDVSAGRVKLRRRSSSAPVPVPGGGGRDTSVVGPRRGRVKQSPGPPADAISSDPQAIDPGVARALAFRRATQG